MRVSWSTSPTIRPKSSKRSIPCKSSTTDTYLTPGGPGKYRGGLALVREYRFTETEGTLQIRSDRHKSNPYSLNGGHPGTRSANVLNPQKEALALPAKTLLTINNGDVLRHTLAGAGGHGDPLYRDPERVLEDVRNEKVSLDSAREIYGVAIHPETWSIDPGLTNSLRRKATASGVSTEDHSVEKS
ncbi:MAG: hypothetical protein CME25_15705 [Gemmatimonadetes bacterium]|nr:hypothetical protein [Gemmatimonadota bacterium]